MNKPLYQFMPSGLSYLNFLEKSISNGRGVWIVSFICPCFIEIPVLNANSVDPDQTPRSVASDLGLHCLLVSVLLDASHK